MMALVHSTAARVIGMGMNLGTIAKMFSAELTVNTADATVIQSGAREHTQGETSGSFSVEGFLTAESVPSAGDGSWDAMKRALGANSVIVAAPIGDAVGKPAAGMIAGGVKGGIMPSLSDNVGLKIEGETQAGPDLGVMLVPWSVRTAVFNGTAVDNTAASTNVVIAAYLSWDAFTGTGVDFVLQHSLDGVTWADVVDFPTISTKRGGARVVAPVGTLNRYRRIIADGGTFTTVTVAGMVATINKPAGA